MRHPNEIERGFLKSVWQNRMFDSRALYFTDGTPFQILDTGTRNGDGVEHPDFIFATLYLPQSNIKLHGSIKIDICSSHWREQGTVNDPNFSSVILHIVLKQDIVIHRGSGAIGTFVISPAEAVVRLYDNIRKGGRCPNSLAQMDSVYSYSILERVMSDRLKRKRDEVLEIYRSTGDDWYETAYIVFMRSFGYRQKKREFETLARTLPLRFLLLHSDSLPRMEALLLGQAGYLDVSQPDKYTLQLQDLHKELYITHELNTRYISWRGATVRPGSLPVQSLVRVAVILKKEESFLTKILSAKNTKEFRVIFDIELSDYWKSHYAPSRPAELGARGMTRQRSELLIINFVIPLLMAYGYITQDEEIIARAMSLYEELPPEDNRYVRDWCGAGYLPKNAFYSQGLIQLSTEYCYEGICGDCPLGVHQMVECFKTSTSGSFKLYKSG